MTLQLETTPVKYFLSSPSVIPHRAPVQSLVTPARVVTTEDPSLPVPRLPQAPGDELPAPGTALPAWHTDVSPGRLLAACLLCYNVMGNGPSNHSPAGRQMAMSSLEKY